MINIFDYLSPVFEKLVPFGFSFDGKTYSYATQILDGQFEMRVDIASNGDIKTQVIDPGTGEPYTLHLVEDAGGSFVGAIRAEYENVLNKIAESCFTADIFKGDIAHGVIKYVSEKYGDELEYLWKTFPSNAIWRRKDNNKWYGILLTLSKKKLGLDSDEQAVVIDLRIDPEILPLVVDGKRYFPGYHMNKKHWFSICLDGSVPLEEICRYIDKSYALAKKG